MKEQLNDESKSVNIGCTSGVYRRNMGVSLLLMSILSALLPRLLPSVSASSSLRRARLTDIPESPHYHNVALKSGVLCLCESDRSDGRRRQ